MIDDDINYLLQKAVSQYIGEAVPADTVFPDIVYDMKQLFFDNLEDE